MEIKELIREAEKARKSAYAPYSNFSVGAALLTDKGVVFHGCNIENASYGLTNCAERTAIFKAVSEGIVKFSALAVIGGTDQPIAPCGACRQVLAEFCSQTMPVYMANVHGKSRTTTVGELLPGAFSKEELLDATE